MKNDSSYGRVIPLPKRKLLRVRKADTKPVPPSLSDMLCAKPADPSATGFLLSSLPDSNGPILWVQDYTSRRDNGYLYAPSLKAFGIHQPILQVHVSAPRDVLWAMEEGAACPGLSAVIGEIHGAPAALSFTATKRLALRADASGVPVYLIRSGDPGVLSAARARWRVSSLPSRPHPHDSHAPGTPQWDVDLFRARGRAPQRWVARYDPSAAKRADRLGLVPRTHDGQVGSGDQSVPDSAGG